MRITAILIALAAVSAGAQYKTFGRWESYQAGQTVISVLNDDTANFYWAVNFDPPLLLPAGTKLLSYFHYENGGRADWHQGADNVERFDVRSGFGETDERCALYIQSFLAK